MEKSLDSYHRPRFDSAFFLIHPNVLFVFRHFFLHVFYKKRDWRKWAQTFESYDLIQLQPHRLKCTKQRFETEIMQISNQMLLFTQIHECKFRNFTFAVPFVCISNSHIFQLLIKPFLNCIILKSMAQRHFVDTTDPWKTFISIVNGMRRSATKKVRWDQLWNSYSILFTTNDFDGVMNILGSETWIK